MTGERLWWENDPAIIEASRLAAQELARDPARDLRAPGPDPVVTELLGGAVWRELGAARDDRERARVRYVDAIRAARVAGFSWGEIGRVLGESRQSLHRRFGAVE